MHLHIYKLFYIALCRSIFIQVYLCTYPQINHLFICLFLYLPSLVPFRPQSQSLFMHMMILLCLDEFFLLIAIFRPTISPLPSAFITKENPCQSSKCTRHKRKLVALWEQKILKRYIFLKYEPKDKVAVLYQGKERILVGRCSLC